MLTTLTGDAPPLAYSYIRFSSPRQAEGDSVRRQTVNPEEWCKRNRVELDTKLRFEDRGRSAFKKHHSDREALTEFRRLVTKGDIKPGSYLIVENLDRLSREEERIAVELLLSIVNAGITVVQLMPEEQTFSPKNLDMLGLMRAVIQMAQAHQESAKKAKRLGEVWGQKRKSAIEGKGLLGTRVPGWLEVVDGRFRPIPARVALLRRIYQLCIAGYGGQAIARRLNDEGVPTLTGRGRWYQSAVTYLLRTRAVLGEFQPHTEHGHEKRVPIGEPVKTYYPRVISDEQFNAAQGAMVGRVPVAGRPPSQRSNLFRGLLRDARGGGSIGIDTRLYLGVTTHNYANMDRKAGVRAYSFPTNVFDDAILSRLIEIDSREVVGESAAAERVLALNGQRAELAAKISRTVDALGDDDSPAIVAKIRTMESQLRDIDDNLAEARQEAANPLASAWGELPQLVEVSRTPDGRVRLAATLRRVIDEVWCLFAPRGENRVAVVQVRFTGGQHRDYVIVHVPARQLGPKVRRKADWAVISAPWTAKPDSLDLRDQGAAAKLEKYIEGIDVKAVTGKPKLETIEAVEEKPVKVRAKRAGKGK